MTTPPLNAGMGSVSFSSSITRFNPRGGRLLVMVKRMPERRRLSTASLARGVITFSGVTKVPSTSLTTRAMGWGAGCGMAALLMAGFSPQSPW